jgi:hypothetical protein
MANEQRCSFDEYQEQQLAALGVAERLAWSAKSKLAEIRAEVRADAVYGESVAEPEIRTIRVWVYVLYRNDAEKIDKSQVADQIKALNRDFRGTLSQPVPTKWAGRLSDARIEFSWDPGDFHSVAVNQAGLFTPDTARAAVTTAASGDDYLNLWVCAIRGYGVADSPLMPDSHKHGVFVDPECFGIITTAGVSHNDGKTCSHEVGHWLGLQHTAGDSLGDTDDSMDVNFMDETADDQTWTLFTPDQVSLMRTYLDSNRSGTWK